MFCVVLALIYQTLLLVVNFVEIADLLPTLLSQLSDENFSSALKKLVAGSPNLGGKWAVVSVKLQFVCRSGRFTGRLL